MVTDRCSLDSRIDELATWLAALKQSVNERDALIQDMNMMIQQQSVTRDISGGTPIPQPDLHRERLERVKEFYGNDDKFVVEQQQEIESDQHEELTQELKGRIAKSHLGRLHAERERCDRDHEGQWNYCKVAQGCACRSTTPVLL